MTTTPAHEPLWDDDRILNWIDDCVYATGDGAQAAHTIASEIVDEYEAVLEFDRTRYAEQLERIATLEQQLESSIRLSNENAEIGARYMRSNKAALLLAGEIINDIDKKDKRIASLEQQLADAQRWVPNLTPESGGMTAEWATPEEDAAWKHLSNEQEMQDA